MNQEKLYWSKEVAALLNIGASTLRKWSLLVEEHGYVFLRDEHDRRAYREQDVEMLRELQSSIREKGMSLENAVAQVTSTRPQEPQTALSLVPQQESITALVVREGHNSQMIEYVNTLVQHIERQEEFNQELLQRLKNHEAYMEVALMRDEKMRTALREIASANQRRSSRRKWYQFWK